MRTREEVLEYGLTFPDTYQDAPFHDENWQLVRYSPNRKAFLWTYEREGRINLNVKVDPEKAFFWRDIYESVIPGYHQNKDHWNTIILDGSIPDQDVKLGDLMTRDLIPLPTGGGAALDLGVAVRPNKYLTLSASILDLGGAIWHYGNATTSTMYMTFNGLGTLSYDQLNEQALKDKAGELADKLKNVVTLRPNRDQTRLEVLPFHANLGVKYILPCYEQVSFGAVASYSHYEYMPYWEARLGVEYKPFDWLDIYGSFGRGAFGNQYGFGLSAAFSKFQLYYCYQNGMNGTLPRSTTPLTANHRTWSIGLTYDL